jgi:hypothetical protein
VSPLRHGPGLAALAPVAVTHYYSTGCDTSSFVHSATHSPPVKTAGLEASPLVYADPFPQEFGDNFGGQVSPRDPGSIPCAGMQPFGAGNDRVGAPIWKPGWRTICTKGLSIGC